MQSENMEPDDFMKRGFLLPEGCKDLPAVWKVKSHGPSEQQSQPHPPPIEIIIPEKTTVLGLATLLKQTIFTIIGDLMKLGIFATINDTLDFEVISVVARLHGCIAKKAA